MSFKMRKRVVTHKESMFTETWLVMAVLITLLGLALKLEALLLTAVLLLTIVPVAWVWNAFALRSVRYERSFSEKRAFVGEKVELTIRVSNAKPLPVAWLRVRDLIPLNLPLEGGDVVPSPAPSLGYLRNAYSLWWFQAIKRRYTIHCARRGIYHFGPVRMESGDIFGLFSQEVTESQRDVFIVYPRVMPLEELGFPPKEPFGETKTRLRFLEDPSRVIGVRDHLPEDSFRRIHWKATARHQKLQTKVYEPTTTFNLVIFLNVATFPKHWQGVDEELLEDVITVAASIAAYALEKRYAVGLVANGCWPHSDQPVKVPPGRSPRHITGIFEALAALTSFATSSIEELLLNESPHIPWGATIVVVTGVLSEELTETMMRLKEKGRRLVLVSLSREKPPFLEGITVYALQKAGERWHCV